VSSLRIAYGGMSEDLSAPGDRRRFAGYAQRTGVEVISTYSDGVVADAAVITLGSDLSRWKTIRDKHKVLILDIVDSYLLESRFSYKRNLRGLYKSLNGDLSSRRLSYSRLLEEVIVNSDLVICASVEQRNFLRILNPRVQVIVDCFEELLVKDFPKTYSKQSKAILWEGFPENLKHMRLIGQALANHQVELICVTSPQMKTVSPFREKKETRIFLNKLGLDASVIPWSIESLLEASRRCALAVIPIDSKDSMAWNKSANKLLGFWAMGLPVLTSPTPSYTQASKDAKVLATLVDDDQWEFAILSILNDPAAASEMAKLGHNYAIGKVSSEQSDLSWALAIHSVL
jgi:hypothetical protein